MEDKTDGNPFFLTQLLYSLYQENLLVFNNSQSSVNREKNQCDWQWNIEQIANLSITENVVDLMISKIAKLDLSTQRILKLAACIGNQFNLEILAIINNKSQKITAKELQSALDKSLVIPLDNQYKVPLLEASLELSNQLSEKDADYLPYIPYKFLHDRIQQAAYALIPESEKKQVHLQIGRLQLQNITENELPNNIFDIVNQLNEGSELISDQLEKNQLAELNLQAGKKAKASTAYESALRYLETSSKLLIGNSWENQYQLTLDIQVETLEAQYLNTKWKQMEQLSVNILQKVSNVLDQVKVYELIILSYYAQFKPNKAIDIAVKALDKLDIKISQADVNGSAITKPLQDSSQNIADLADLPEMIDSYKLSAISILQPLITPTLTTNFPLFVETILTQLNLCFKFGNPPQAAGIYSCYGMLLCGVIEDIDSGYRFGKLSISLLEKYNTPKIEPLAMHVYYGFIWHWKEFLNNEKIPEKLIDCIQQGLDIGNNEYASYFALNYCLIRFFKGHNLEQVEQDYRKYSKLIKKTNQEYSINYIEICSNIVTNLRNVEQNTCLLIGESQDEENKSINEYIKQQNQWLIFIFYFGKTIVAYFLKDYFTAFNNSQDAEKYAVALVGYLCTPQHNFYSSLTCLAYYRVCEVKQHDKILNQVAYNQEKMKKWAEHCPENFQHKYDLVAAENARVLGQNWQAQELYDQAIQGAKKYEFIHEEALAYERAAEFYLALRESRNRATLSQKCSSLLYSLGCKSQSSSIRSRISSAFN